MLFPTLVKDARPGYRPFSATVARVARLTPHFTRVTFTGDDFGTFGTDALDQRVKIVFPLADGTITDFGAEDAETITAGTWYARWRALPDEKRNPFRTYTVRAVRPELAELDVDMVTHGDGGPAARWLAGAAAGDQVVIVGPDAHSLDSGIGIDFHPGSATRLLLAGDETAAPAICAVLESLPADREVHAFIEIPDAADALPIDSPADARVTWLPRGAAAHGSLLDPAVRDWVAGNHQAYASALCDRAQQLDDVDVDTELLWDSFGEASTSTPGSFYAWLAGESAVIKGLRRLLVSETGIDRGRVSFMGYWRLGRAEAQ